MTDSRIYPDTTSAPDGIRERGRYYDIIIQALVDYDGWMLDDDYDATAVLTRIMKRMRGRVEMSDPPTGGNIEDQDDWRKNPRWNADKVDKLLGRITALAQSGKVSNLADALALKYPASCTPYGNGKGPSAFTVNLAGFVIEYLAALRAPEATIEVHGFVQVYNFCLDGGGIYIPTDRDKAMIEDAINCYIAECEQASSVTSTQRETLK